MLISASLWRGWSPLGMAAAALMAINPMAPAGNALTLSICGADGITRDVTVPLDPDQPRRSDCAKACHGACSRKLAGVKTALRKT